MRALIILFLAASTCGAAQRPERKLTIIVVAKNQQEAANQAMVDAFGPGAAGTFSVPFHIGAGVPTNPTHYVACWALTDERYAMALDALDGIVGLPLVVLRHTRAATPSPSEFKGRPRAKLAKLNIRIVATTHRVVRNDASEPTDGQ